MGSKSPEARFETIAEFDELVGTPALAHQAAAAVQKQLDPGSRYPAVKGAVATLGSPAAESRRRRLVQATRKLQRQAPRPDVV